MTKLIGFETKTIKQSELTADCWMIQLFGLERCTHCMYKDTEDCGGGETLEKLKNGTKV